MTHGGSSPSERKTLYVQNGSGGAPPANPASLYPETMKAAFADQDRVADAKAKLVEAGVKYVMSCWIDLLGQPKTKPVPVAEFEALCAGKGPQFAVHSVSMFPELGPADSDQIMVPDLDSLVICPWDRTCAWVFADLYWEDKPYNLCPRMALKRQVKQAAEKGYWPMAGIEPEFITMRYVDGKPVKAFDNDPVLPSGGAPKRQGWGYDAEASIDSIAFLGQLIDILGELNWEIKDVVAEGAYSQFELDFGYTNVVAMADRLTFLRVLLKEVAKQHGMFVTFMPKPTLGDWRSGAHINFSIQAADGSGRNLLGDSENGWSDAINHVLGGLLRHGGALTAITCPTVNSYKGLVPKVPGFEGGVYTWAPTHMTYGSNNRSAMLRLPQNRFCVENRATDMCMNAYLGLAMTTAAAVKGLDEKLEAGPSLDRDLYKMTAAQFDEMGIQRLPRTLGEAIEIFDEDELAKEVLGEVMHNSFSLYKHDEWERYSVYISDWEVEEYLRFF